MPTDSTFATTGELSENEPKLVMEKKATAKVEHIYQSGVVTMTYYYS